MRRRMYIDNSTEEISWTFNDFILGFLMIVLMMASMFAFLSNSVVVDSFINQCEDPEDPSCGVGNTLFGGLQKGERSDKLVELPAEQAEAAADVAAASLKKWSGIGEVAGNSEVAFGTPELTPQKQNIVFEILPDGNLLYRGEITSVEDMQKLINNIALEKGVYLEAIVHSGTPFEVYKTVRNQLWDMADAEHWRDVVQTEYNKEGLREGVARYGTTYLEAAETQVLQEAPREDLGSQRDQGSFFDGDFGAIDEGWTENPFQGDAGFEDAAGFEDTSFQE